jgi:hypothetical protein
MDLLQSRGNNLLIECIEQQSSKTFWPNQGRKMASTKPYSETLKD